MVGPVPRADRPSPALDEDHRAAADRDLWLVARGEGIALEAEAVEPRNAWEVRDTHRQGLTDY